MASESSGRTFQEYLEHHLQNLVFGPLPEGHERKFYSKGETTSEKEIYCQDKNMDYDGEKYCKETLSQDGWYLANNKTDIEAMGFGRSTLTHYSFQFFWVEFFFLYLPELPETFHYTNQANYNYSSR